MNISKAEVSVNLDKKSYPIIIGKSLLNNVQNLKHYFKPLNLGEKICIISNPIIAKHYLTELKKALKNHQLININIPAGEQYKTLKSADILYQKLLENNFNRNSTIIALGGGVIGDLSGFVAATWMRGINYIQIPTTLLSQVDSSVGGKTGINLTHGKNMVGSFHHPQLVLSDIDTLKTLPQREFSAGLAEIIKYGLIYDASFFQWLQNNINALMTKQEQALIYAIERSCQIKAEIVALDETEQNLRAILNFGHTFGHALEAITQYNLLLHGEAIAIGMMYACRLSQKLGWLNTEQVLCIENLLKQAELPIIEPKGIKISGKQYLEKMTKDKKNKDTGLPLILLTKIGKAEICLDYGMENLQELF